jgi:hypothetical protein
MCNFGPVMASVSCTAINMLFYDYDTARHATLCVLAAAELASCSDSCLSKKS